MPASFFRIKAGRLTNPLEVNTVNSFASAGASTQPVAGLIGELPYSSLPYPNKLFLYH